MEQLGFDIGENWITLGRRLRVKEAELKEIDHRPHDRLREKGFQMLLHWKQKEGSAATYQALCKALRHELVGRKDLAERFCCLDGKYCGLSSI